MLRVINVLTGEHLPDRIERTRYSSAAWDKDAEGFCYTRYPRPGQVPLRDENYNSRVFYHRLGDDPVEDVLAFKPRGPLRLRQRSKEKRPSPAARL